MATRFDSIRDLVPMKEQWRIKVRVIRLWRQPNFQRPKFGDNVEMVLIDEHGGKIQATIRGSLKTRDQVEEDGIYVIKNFGVGLNFEKFKVTQHEYRLTFNLRTIVTPNVDAIFPINGFSFMEFEHIQNYPNDTDCLIDVIGFLCGIKDSKELMVSGKRTKMISIELDDLRGMRLSCSLWEGYAEEVIQYNNQNSTKPTVIIIQFARMKKWMGKMGLSNSKYATKILFNHECPEVQSFRFRLPDAQSESAHKLTQLSNQEVNSQSVAFWKETTRKYICDMKDSREAMTCVTYATIKGIESAFNWWYKSCKKCTRSVYSDESKWYCRNCDTHFPTYYPKFSLKVRVVDGTDSASFVLFDKDSTNLINLTAAELREQHFQRGGDLEKYPHELDSLIDRSYLFKVNVKKVNIDSYQEVAYQVSRVCCDEDIIQSFVNFGHVEEHGSMPDVHLNGVPEATVSQVEENLLAVRNTLEFSEQNEENDCLETTPTSKLANTSNIKVVEHTNLLTDLLEASSTTKAIVEGANLVTDFQTITHTNKVAEPFKGKPNSPTNKVSEADEGKPNLVSSFRRNKAMKIEKE